MFAEPEVLQRRLTGRHPFFVVASDGVWEFLTSQSVVDMVSKFDDPYEAATAIVAESYRLWLQNDTRTDDITIVVVRVESIEEEAATMLHPTPYCRGGPLEPPAAPPALLPSVEVRCCCAPCCCCRGGDDRGARNAELLPWRPPALLPSVKVRRCCGLCCCWRRGDDRGARNAALLPPVPVRCC